MGFEGKNKAPKDLIFCWIFSCYFECGLGICRSCHKSGRLQKFFPDIGLVCCSLCRLPSYDLDICRFCRSSGHRNFVFLGNDRCCHKIVRLQKPDLDIFRFYRTFFRSHPYVPCIFRFRRNIFPRQWHICRAQTGKTGKTGKQWKEESIFSWPLVDTGRLWYPFLSSKKGKSPRNFCFMGCFVL